MARTLFRVLSGIVVLTEAAGAGASDVDLAPMVLVADAFTLGRRKAVAPFAF